jgi:sugar phosphate isomerase/epimerase
MHALKFAVAAHCFPGPLKQSTSRIARTGARGVQYDSRNELKPSEFSETGRRQLLHMLDEVGLSIASLSFPTRRSLYDPQELEARVAAIKRVMEFSALVRAGVVTLRAGRIPDEPDSNAYLLLREVLNDLCRYGNRVGAMLALTPTSDSAAALRRIVTDVHEGPIGIHFDPAVFVMSGQSAGESMRALHELLVQIQVRDAIRDIDGSGQEVPVGRGEVEWEEFLALVEETHYRGWLTVDRTRGDDPAGDVIRAIEYLKEVAQG